jgi:hypothetical protein
MATPERSIPGVDIDGFVAVEDLAARIKRLGVEAVARTYRVPGLVVDASANRSATKPMGSNQRLEASYKSTTDEDQPLPDHMTVLLRYAGGIAFLTKRPGSLFPEMISIGRALNCDIVVALSSVSKIHGLVHDEGGGRWSYSDQASKNGTLLNGNKLTPGDRHPLASGDRLQIGLHLTCVFLEPASILARLGKG